MKALFALLVFAAAPAWADIIQFRGPQGEIYQVDGNVKVERGGGVSSRMRWPSNEVDRILVIGCDVGRGTLQVEVKGKWANSFAWTNEGDRVLDLVARTVCKAR